MVVFRVCVRVYPSSKNIHTAFEDLIKGDDYTDVTFAWGDGHTNEAHKVIIAALLKRNKHSLIYMRGIKSEDLLKIAEELQLKGLNGSEGRRGYWESPQISGKQRKNETFGTKTSFISKSHSGDNIMSTTAFAIFKQELLGDMNELDEQIKTMMGWSKTRVKITCDTWHVTCDTWHVRSPEQQYLK